MRIARSIFMKIQITHPIVPALLVLVCCGAVPRKAQAYAEASSSVTWSWSETPGLLVSGCLHIYVHAEAPTTYYYPWNPQPTPITDYRDNSGTLKLENTEPFSIDVVITPVVEFEEKYESGDGNAWARAKWHWDDSGKVILDGYKSQLIPFWVTAEACGGTTMVPEPATVLLLGLGSLGLLRKNIR